MLQFLQINQCFFIFSQQLKHSDNVPAVHTKIVFHKILKSLKSCSIVFQVFVCKNQLLDGNSFNSSILKLGINCFLLL